MYWSPLKPVTGTDISQIWAKVAEVRTTKGDHDGAVRALRAVEINQPLPLAPALAYR